MHLTHIIAELELEVCTPAETTGGAVCGGYTGDLLSDVMAHSLPGQLWITRQTHRNVIAVAALKEHSGVILAQGARPDEEMLQKAEKEKIMVALSVRPAFDIAGRLYQLLAAATDG